MDLRPVYVTYEEAQKLKPYFQAGRAYGPTKEIRLSSGRILAELELVRGDIDYSPLHGRQIFLNKVDHDFLLDVMDQVGL